MARALRRLLAAVGLGLTLTALAAAPASAALKAIWGPTAVLPYGGSPYPVYQHLGVDVLQVQLEWDRAAPTRPASPKDPFDPAYRWPAALDQTIADAEAAGMEVLLQPMRTPGWANGGREYRWRPDRLADYAEFVKAAARRYRTVRLWMVWGEPVRNLLPMPNNPSGPQLYARLLDKAYRALKQVRKRNVVIGGNNWTAGSIRPQSWVRWMKLPNGKPPRLDWFGHNPFTTRKPNIRLPEYFPGMRDISDSDLLHKELKRAYRSRHRKPKLWLSEFTVVSDGPNSVFGFWVSREEQAQWLRAAYRIARRHRYIAGLGWWKLVDEGLGPGVAHAGLLTYDGHPKPAYYAYRAAK